jgi:orotidine-5'-phosphate decarboxylase
LTMDDDVRGRLVLALDVDDMVAALRLAHRLRPWFGVAKVGLELFSAEGPEAVTALLAEGYRVFVDLKMHDIPTTVQRAARVVGGLGAAYTTVHAAGGVPMMRAAVEGMAQGAEAAGVASAVVLGVTVLTSEADVAPALLARRAADTASAGCGGFVCAAADLVETRRAAPGLVAVVPGIRPPGASTDDQARAAEPSGAIGAGADLLVLGRAVTGAADPENVARSVSAEVEASIGALRG